MPDRTIDEDTHEDAHEKAHEDERRNVRWSTSALRDQLDPLLPGLSVEVLERTASTNSVLLERVRAAGGRTRNDADAPALVRLSVESAAFGRLAPPVRPCLLVAEAQTAGRGRLGRAWHSAAGASLTFSLALALRADDWSGLSLAVGVAVADALDPRAAPEPADTDVPGQAGRDSSCRARIGLKWPNDLWLMDGAGAGVGRKLGGILIETVMVGAQRVAVVGIGLNVRPSVLSASRADSADAGNASSGFASVDELDATASAPGVLQRVALPLARALRQFEGEGFGAFCDRFAARDLLRDQPVRTTQPGVAEGVARGVSAQGALWVQTPSGRVPVSSGEVSVRLNPGAGLPVGEALDACAARAPC